MKLTEFGGVMDDAISRLREKAQNEATCFALNDECKHLRQQLAECQRERDELVEVVSKAVKLNSFREFNDHILAMKAALAKLATVTKERDELVEALGVAKIAMEKAKALPVWDCIPHALHIELDKIFTALAKVGADKTGEGS